MSELRWVLLGLGALILIGVYLWGRGFFRRNARPLDTRPRRLEPQLSAETVSPEAPSADRAAEPAAQPQPKSQPPPPPEKVVALRLVPHGGEIPVAKAVTALREADLEHGRYGIFHRLAPNRRDELFSVASLTEPGTFDLDNMDGATLAGMTIFMVLPGTGDPVARFDEMVLTARSLAVTLDGELYDERGSSWSVQRERYVREEVIEYRHQLERR